MVAGHVAFKNNWIPCYDAEAVSQKDPTATGRLSAALEEARSGLGLHDANPSMAALIANLLQETPDLVN